MMDAFLAHTKCPRSYVDRFTCSPLSEREGFFKFGDLGLYGRLSTGAVSDNTPTLCRVLIPTSRWAAHPSPYRLTRLKSSIICVSNGMFPRSTQRSLTYRVPTHFLDGSTML